MQRLSFFLFSSYLLHPPAAMLDAKTLKNTRFNPRMISIFDWNV
jgi:hypothetical protein